MSQYPTTTPLDQCQVSPPPCSVPTTTLPLTFFDIPWLLCRPMQRLFFYDLPYPTSHFTRTALPPLKTSLSLALQHFFPLAGNLISPPSPNKPYILYTDGDSISFTLAKTTALDLGKFITNHPRDVKDSHPFAPKLPPARVGQDGTRVVPLLAVQLTLFPNTGVCVGVQFHHVVADGMTFNHFIKSWASIFKTGRGEQSLVPCFDRELIKDPFGVESIFLQEWWKWASVWDYNLGSTDEQLAHKVRATFIISQAQIESLKSWVLTQLFKMDNSISTRLSTFVVTSAFIWVTMIRSQEKENGDGFDLVNGKQKVCHFGFVADCRRRLKPELPTTYFGNCLDICVVSVEKREILGENGMAVAARAIGDKVNELESGVLKGAGRWMSNWKEMEEEGGLTTVAGSPRLRVCDTDFGWGRLKKSELVQIDVSGAIYISESGNEDGGIELGLALTASTIDVFSSIFQQLLKQV